MVEEHLVFVQFARFVTSVSASDHRTYDARSLDLIPIYRVLESRYIDNMGVGCRCRRRRAFRLASVVEALLPCLHSLCAYDAVNGLLRICKVSVVTQSLLPSLRGVRAEYAVRIRQIKPLLELVYDP